MITIQDLFWLIPSASVLALIFAGIFFYRMKAQDEGNEVMKMIARHVRSGAMAYLRQQYKIVAIFFVLITVVFAFLAYCLHIQNPWVPFAFISGGFFSGLAGYIGMKTATYASGRVANACRHSLDAGLQIAFRSGAVLGLTVVGLAMLDIGAWYWVLDWFYGDMELSMRLVVITTTMLTFGMGASLQALFARVGGGIFTKAADVGADLVGKVEAGIPEDDPRNPATIADNVGDNVGDVAGMGADLYESYCGSILASAALGAAAYMAVPEMAIKAVLTPMLIAALGTILSLLGVYAVRVKRGASQTELMAALNRGINLSSFLIAIASAFLLPALIPADVAAQAAQMQSGAITPDAAQFDTDLLSAVSIFTSVGYIAKLFLFILLFMVGGFLFYAAIFAAIGSAVGNIQDASQLTSFATIPIIFALIIAMMACTDPNSSLSLWCSYIPLTSPMVMMARVPFGTPDWQTWLSLAILYLSFFGMAWVSAKIYRIGIFMYGKKPSVRDLIRWARYK